MVVWVLEDELFAAERRLGVVLLQDVEVAQLHPGLPVVHKLLDVPVQLRDGAPVVALGYVDGNLALASLSGKYNPMIGHFQKIFQYV